MARTPLSTDFKDDILDESMSGKRRYNLNQNSDGTYSFEDVSVYEQKGSDFGAKQVNEVASSINEIYEDKLVTLDEVGLVTEPGFFVDALAVAELAENVFGERGSYSTDDCTYQWRKYKQNGKMYADFYGTYSNAALSGTAISGTVFSYVTIQKLQLTPTDVDAIGFKVKEVIDGVDFAMGYTKNFVMNAGYQSVEVEEAGYAKGYPRLFFYGTSVSCVLTWRMTCEIEEIA